MTYDCSVLGINAPEKPSDAWRNMERVTTDEEGREITREPYQIRTFQILGSGFPLGSYRPQHPDTMKQIVKWAFEGVTKNNSPAVVGAMRASAEDGGNKRMFPWAVDQNLGSESWTWPSMPLCKQKLIDVEMFDPQSQYFKRGGHMPLMVFVGGHNQQRRTKGACERRERRAEQRGWGAERRERRAEQRGWGAEQRGWKGGSRGNDWSRGSADTCGDGADRRGWQDWRGAWSSDANDNWQGAWNSDDKAWSSDDNENWQGAWNSDDYWWGASWWGAWSNR